MKRNLILAAAVFAALLLSITSCEKEGTSLYEGYYSFKTSGTLTIDRKVNDSDSDDSTGDDTTGDDTTGDDTAGGDTTGGDDTSAGTTSLQPSSALDDLLDSLGVSLPELRDSLGIDSDVTLPTEDGTFKTSLTSESGQMNVVTTGENTMIVTLNIVGGDVLVFDATVDGKKITLSPISRILTIKDEGLTFTIDATLEGTGEKYEDVVIFSLKYTGDTSYLVYNYTITDSSVKCVAKLNN